MVIADLETGEIRLSDADLEALDGEDDDGDAGNMPAEYLSTEDPGPEVQAGRPDTRRPERPEVEVHAPAVR
ncbi:hypothetical protein ABT352_23535 [Streptosporangium sp. NPDC000563]|uniref:hypothetical protein n=1 Tax=Streptosporangium sp. NPDC000563 TaxID=3154366 RepID=UPI00331B6153